MAIKFLYVSPEQIDNLPQKALDYLQDAIRRTPASTSRLDVTLDIAKKGYGGIYIITGNDEIIGCCYMLEYNTPEGKVLSPVLLGGDNMEIWFEDWIKFCGSMMDHIGAKPFRLIGRKGWKKKFPKLKVIGYVYEYIVP